MTNGKKKTNTQPKYKILEWNNKFYKFYYQCNYKSTLSPSK